MKRDFQRATFVVASCIWLSACGQAQSVTSGFQTASATCSGSALPQQFIVRHMDDSIEVVHAPDESTFRSGYMVANADTIKYAEHDYMVHVEPPVQVADTGSSTSDPEINWGPSKIEADKLWAQNIYGANVIVAVVDTGMDITHPQLQPNVYINPGESGTDAQGRPKQSNGIDDDANGYIDDYTGYNFVGNKPLTGDNQYHGTHVSGILAAYHHDTVAQSEPYIQGVAPSVKLMPLAFLDNTGAGSMSDGVRAIQYAVAQGAQVINASWGGTQCSQALRDEIATLPDKNVIFVAAAGNDAVNIDTTPEYPAALNLAAQFTVGATGDHDAMADYSNFGLKAVHIFAPGTNIYSTLPMLANSSVPQMGYLSGTSMATPFVTGAVALLLSAVPDATAAQIRSALYNSAMHNSEYLNASQGRTDLAQAVAQLHLIVGH